MSGYMWVLNRSTELMEEPGSSSASSASTSPSSWRPSRVATNGARNKNKVRCETDLWRKMKAGRRPDLSETGKAPSWSRRLDQSGPVDECLPADWTIRRLLSKLLVAAPAVDVEAGEAMSNKMGKNMKKRSIRFVKVRPEEEAEMKATAPASPVVNCVGQVSRKKTPPSDGLFGTTKRLARV